MLSTSYQYINPFAITATIKTLSHFVGQLHISLNASFVSC